MMTTPTVITSVRNPRIRAADRLRSARQRSRQGRILIEGRRELRLAVEAGIRLEELFVNTEFMESLDAGLLAQLSEAAEEVLQVAPHCYEKIAFGDRGEGVVATATPPSVEIADADFAERVRIENGPVAILDGIEKPGNVGAILRTADAAGVSAVLVTNPATDMFNPNTIRASLGTVFSLPVATATVGAAAGWLAERGVTIYAARVDADSDYTEVDWAAPAAVILGSEATGVSEDWARADVVGVRLPMRGTADSLNVSATAAVLFYEALRQRSVSGR